MNLRGEIALNKLRNLSVILSREFKIQEPYFIERVDTFILETIRKLKEEKRILKSEVVTLKEECQLRWNQLRWDEGEAAISECGKLKLDIKCLEEMNKEFRDAS